MFKNQQNTIIWGSLFFHDTQRQSLLVVFWYLFKSGIYNLNRLTWPDIWSPPFLGVLRRWVVDLAESGNMLLLIVLILGRLLIWLLWFWFVVIVSTKKNHFQLKNELKPAENIGSEPTPLSFQLYYNFQETFCCSEATSLARRWIIVQPLPRQCQSVTRACLARLLLSIGTCNTFYVKWWSQER